MERLSSEAEQYLIALAHKAVSSWVADNVAPDVDRESMPHELLELGAVFVTLHKQGALRGCIGHTAPIQPLYEDVIENARNAALGDPRFPPVVASELPEIAIEVSHMAPFSLFEYTTIEGLCTFLDAEHPGVMIRDDAKRALFLPQVWEQLPKSDQFLGQLCIKAGLSRLDWKLGKLEVSINSVVKYR
ncbi:MAG: AmmeMemoRadiSam system protein A [Fibrobacterales bacterium]